MSIKYITRVWEDAAITNRCTLLVMLTLADCANDTGVSWPSIETISKNARCSIRTVHEELRLLESSGKLKTDSGRGRHQTNTYQLYPGENVHSGVNNMQSSAPKASKEGEKVCNPARQIAHDPSGTVSTENRKEPSAGAEVASPPTEPKESRQSSHTKELTDGYGKLYAQHIGRKYPFRGATDGQAVKRLLSYDCSVQEILDVAAKCFKRRAEGFPFSTVTSLASMTSQWSNIIGKIPLPRKSSATSVPRAAAPAVQEQDDFQLAWNAKLARSAAEKAENAAYANSHA